MRTVRNLGQQGGISRARRKANRFIAAHADYRREDFIFPRTQSLIMRDCTWEGREKKLPHWGFNFVANLAWDIFA